MTQMDINQVNVKPRGVRRVDDRRNKRYVIETSLAVTYDYTADDAQERDVTTQAREVGHLVERLLRESRLETLTSALTARYREEIDGTLVSITSSPRAIYSSVWGGSRPPSVYVTFDLVAEWSRPSHVPTEEAFQAHLTQICAWTLPEARALIAEAQVEFAMMRRVEIAQHEVRNLTGLLRREADKQARASIQLEARYNALVSEYQASYAEQTDEIWASDEVWERMRELGYSSEAIDYTRGLREAIRQAHLLDVGRLSSSPAKIIHTDDLEAYIRRAGGVEGD